jgi:hypothetical protein
VELERHLGVFWRHRRLLGIAALLGVVLAFVAAFKVPEMKRRGETVYSSTSTIMVTQAGFPWGRVVLPGSADVPGATDAPTTGDSSSKSDNQIDFADPGRFSNLATVYSILAHSDEIRLRLKQKVTSEQITAAPLDVNGRGDQFLPMIDITTTDKTAAAAFDLNSATIKALNDYLVEQMDSNNVPRRQRVELTTINKPTPPILVEGPSFAPPMLAFLLAIIAGISVCYILENFKLGRVIGQIRSDSADDEFQRQAEQRGRLLVSMSGSDAVEWRGPNESRRPGGGA